MKVYIATIEENSLGGYAGNIGVFTTQEKAEKALLHWVNCQENNPFLSLEEYKRQFIPKFVTIIEEWELK